MSQARTRDLPVFPLTPDPVRGDASRDAAPVHHQIEATGAEDGPRIALITLGCDKNTVDSERMMAALVGHGAHVSSEVDGADVVIVNTCGFIPTMERPLRVLSTATSHTSYLKISEGCDHTCAFCAIPLMRGLHRSQPVDLLVREAAGLGEMGVKEINIISQDTTWFGRDLKRKDQSAPLLRELLQGLIEGTDVPWYRLFYMYPSGITRAMVDFMASEARILPYLDMPIQHGSDRVLGLMRRPERQATIRERVGWLREAIPDLTLRTTVIVGFPGETDADFREMLELLDEIQFERVGAFTYSVEEGTRAADMDGQIDQHVMNERLEELMELQRGISFDKNAALIGQTMTALVDRLIHDDPEFGAVARTVGQALDVDGVTNIRKADALEVGSLIEVEIVDALDYDLVAELK
jgi:ribosomal protein S12 methylthiotransferase